MFVFLSSSFAWLYQFCCVWFPYSLLQCYLRDLSSYCLFSAVLSTKLEKKPLLFPNYFISISFFFFFQCLFLTVCARLFVVCSSLSLLLFSIESTRLLFYKQEKQKKPKLIFFFCHIIQVKFILKIIMTWAFSIWSKTMDSIFITNNYMATQHFHLIENVIDPSWAWNCYIEKFNCFSP